eukprot:2417526-Alexandrium_andersonii.AAC.1
MANAREYSVREGTSEDERARLALEGAMAFPFTNDYEPLCFGLPAEGRGGLDLRESGKLGL